jgi:hypothetical protein
LLRKTQALAMPKLAPFLTGLASMYSDAGQLADAEKTLRRVVKLMEDTKNKSGQTVAMNNLGCGLAQRR